MSNTILRDCSKNIPYLVADSSTATGLAYAAPAAGGGMTLLSTTTLSGSLTTISSISQSYKHLWIVGLNAYSSTGAALKMELNTNATAANYRVEGSYNIFATVDAFTGADDAFGAVTSTNTWNTQTSFLMEIPRYTETQNKLIKTTSIGNADRGYNLIHQFNSTSAITDVGFKVSTGTFSGGTVYVYGVN